MADHQLPPEDVDASAQAMAQLVDDAGAPHADPKEHIHIPAAHAKATSWLSKFVAPSTIEKYEASYHMGNFVITRATGKKEFETMSIYVRLGMHLLYYGSMQASLLHAEKAKNALKEQSIEMGKKYDSPESKTHIRPFIDSFDLNKSMEEMVKPDPDSYATFNEFFGREIRPEARPIAEPDNDRVVSSPADSRLTTFPTIDLATKYWIKGFGFTLEKLLGSAELAASFDGGSIAIARLAPQDYHRWHAPVSGTVVSVTDIPGAYYTVNPQAIQSGTTLDVFCENKRSVMILTHATTGAQMALIAVGAMLVGSIAWLDGIATPGAQVKRGQCLGSFYYGGSTVIALFPKGAVTLDADLVANSTEEVCETLVQVGWRIGATP